MKYLSRIINCLLLIFIIILNTNASTVTYLPDGDNNCNDTLTTEELEAKIIALTEKVKKENRLVDVLTSDKAYSLPIGIAKSIGGMTIIIVVDDVKFTRNGAVAKAYMNVKFSGSEKNICFMADSIAFFPWGFLDAKLKLVTKKPIKVGNLKLNLIPDKTFVHFDCKGYNSTSLGAVVEFPKDLLVKEDPATRKKITNETVKAEFITEFTDYNDILIDINIDPFQLKNLDGFGFYTQKATIDLSDIRNPQFGAYTNMYIKDLGLGLDAPLWRGIYIKKFEVKLPKDMNGKDSLSAGIGAQDMLFDDNGFTGKLFASNILTLEKGSIAGWQFSIDTLKFALQASSFDYFNFSGKINLPVSEKPSPMYYNAIIDDKSNYTFAVSPPDSTKFDLWAANVELYDNSKVAIIKKSGKYNVKAVLNGKMSIGLPKGDGVQLADISFEGMVIQTDKPNFDINSFEAGSGKMKGFPIQVKSISYKKENNKHGINIRVLVTLVKANDNGFSALGDFTIYGENVNQNSDNNSGGIASWKYSHTEFNKFSIDVHQSAFSFTGSLEIFRNDKTYGDGIKGMVTAWFKPGMGVQAVVQFGNVKGYRYWYADAFASFAAPAVIFPGVGLYGFGGGAYYHMKQIYTTQKKLPKTPMTKYDTTQLAGVSLSGVKYIPNDSIWLGLKASTLIGTIGNIKTFNAKVTFAMDFNNGGGINSISLKGDALFMSDPGTPKNKAKIYAGLFLKYDVAGNDLFGNMETYVNVNDAIVGIGENGKAGEGQLYFSDNDWYVYLGQPTDRMGVKLMSVIQAEAYFVTGTTVPGIPQPPSEVSEILGDIDLDMCRDINQLDNAGGFAFGARLKVATERKEVLIFYGDFNMGVGFDLMLVNYGDDVHCEGYTDPLGINGWYASGQMYAYVQGTIGLHIKIFRKEKDVNILDIGAAAILQAQLPNPLYLKGAVGGYYNVFGGLVKGHCNFEFEVGEKCNMVGGDVLDGINVIADFSPKSGTTGVDVFASPQVAFNYQINKKFQMTDIDNSLRTFRIKLDHCNFKCDGKIIHGRFNWNADTTVLAFESHEILPPKKEIKGDVKVVFEEYKNSKWETVKTNGEVAAETQQVTFVTGEAPNYIPLRNVLYCYPTVNQLNFYPHEYSKGYIQLDKGQNYLFEFPPDERWILDARFVCNSHWRQVDYTYNKQEKRIDFTIPENLSNSTVYEFKLVNIPVVENKNVDDNVAKEESLLATGGDTLTTKKIEGEVRQSVDEETMLAYHIRTSKYNTFNAKINALDLLYDASSVIVAGFHRHSKYFDADELFGSIEINGDNRTDPLIQCSFVAQDNYWYKKYVYDLVYKNYYNFGITLDRPKLPLGIPPVNSVFIKQTGGNFILNEQVITTGIIDWQLQFKSFKLYSAYKMYNDYLNLKSKAYNSNYNENTYLQHLIDSKFETEILNKRYDFIVKYILPGINKITTTKTFSIHYE